MRAAMCAKEDTARLLLRRGARVNEQDYDGITALHYAAVKGSLLMVELLLESSADPNLPDADGETALLLAARHDYLHVATKLLQHNADPDSRARDGETPLYWAGQHRNRQLLTLMGAPPSSSPSFSSLPASSSSLSLSPSSSRIATYREAGPGLSAEEVTAMLVKYTRQPDDPPESLKSPQEEERKTLALYLTSCEPGMTDSMLKDGIVPLLQPESLVSVVELNLADNNIQDPGLCVLAGALKHNTTLTSLDLSDNKFSSEGVVALAAALIDHPALTKLALSNNVLGDSGVQAVCTLLEKNKVLTVLSLENTGLERQAARCLLWVFENYKGQVNTALSVLEVGRNPGIPLDKRQRLKTLCNRNQKNKLKMKDSDVFGTVGQEKLNLN
eukprot:gb/GEZN01008254.1/.p1 GENE.gb/GEZN01008254.1/~~gb/GEZN01008254.1/.p1  ORF type:complete len:387 (-),score=74.47 gb/GEZN01008254.1/:11-1171(-)